MSVSEQDDVVRAYLRERGVVRDYGAFVEWCSANARRPVGHEAFHSELMEAAKDTRPGSAMMTERELVAALARLWAGQFAWRRLEASSTDTPTGGAYCCPVDGHPLPGRSSQTYDLIALGHRCPRPVRELARLRDESGWQRIELVGTPGRAPGGWCERPDGSGLHLTSFDGYGDQVWAAPRWARPAAAEQVLAGKAGSDMRWAFLEGMDIGADGDPYLDRLRIVQTPLFGIYLHHIHRPDRDRDPHDHPWSFISLVLAGGYTEQVWRDKLYPSSFRTRERRRWTVARMSRRAAHMITGINGPLWTLVLTGPRRGAWGFWHLGEFIPWREYTSQADAADGKIFG